MKLTRVCTCLVLERRRGKEEVYAPYRIQIIQTKGLRRASLTYVVLTEVEVKINQIRQDRTSSHVPEYSA